MPRANNQRWQPFKGWWQAEAGALSDPLWVAADLQRARGRRRSIAPHRCLGALHGHRAGSSGWRAPHGRRGDVDGCSSCRRLCRGRHRRLGRRPLGAPLLPTLAHCSQLSAQGPAQLRSLGGMVFSCMQEQMHTCFQAAAAGGRGPPRITSPSAVLGWPLTLVCSPTGCSKKSQTPASLSRSKAAASSAA